MYRLEYRRANKRRGGYLGTMLGTVAVAMRSATCGTTQEPCGYFFSNTDGMTSTSSTWAGTVPLGTAPGPLAREEPEDSWQFNTSFFGIPGSGQKAFRFRFRFRFRNQILSLCAGRGPCGKGDDNSLFVSIAKKEQQQQKKWGSGVGSGRDVVLAALLFTALPDGYSSSNSRSITFAFISATGRKTHEEDGER